MNSFSKVWVWIVWLKGSGKVKKLMYLVGKKRKFKKLVHMVGKKLRGGKESRRKVHIKNESIICLYLEREREINWKILSFSFLFISLIFISFLSIKTVPTILLTLKGCLMYREKNACIIFHRKKSFKWC